MIDALVWIIGCPALLFACAWNCQAHGGPSRPPLTKTQIAAREAKRQRQAIALTRREQRQH
jgi:hypothetical protein